jgi:hypothetical protein
MEVAVDHRHWFLKNAGSLPIMLFETRQDREAWLKEHHAESRGIWLKIAKKENRNPFRSNTEIYRNALEK